LTLLDHPAPGCRLDDFLHNPSMHLAREYVEPNMFSCTCGKRRPASNGCSIIDGSVRLLAVKLDDDAV